MVFRRTSTFNFSHWTFEESPPRTHTISVALSKSHSGLFVIVHTVGICGCLRLGGAVGVSAHFYTAVPENFVPRACKTHIYLSPVSDSLPWRDERSGRVSVAGATGTEISSVEQRWATRLVVSPCRGSTSITSIISDFPRFTDVAKPSNRLAFIDYAPIDHKALRNETLPSEKIRELNLTLRLNEDESDLPS